MAPTFRWNENLRRPTPEFKHSAPVLTPAQTNSSARLNMKVGSANNANATASAYTILRLRALTPDPGKLRHQPGWLLDPTPPGKGLQASVCPAQDSIHLGQRRFCPGFTCWMADLVLLHLQR